MNHDSGPPSRTRRDRIDPRALGSVLVNSKAIALAALRHGLIVFANPAFLATFRATNALVGTPLADIVVDAGGDQLADTLLAAEHAPTRYYGAGKRGEDPSFDLELSLECTELDGEPTIVAFACDVTRQHRSREQLANLAYNDALTGLANRALFADHLHQAVQHARRHPAIFAVLVMDLDGFKAINDTMVIRWAMSPCNSWRSASSTIFGKATHSPGLAATNSPCCCHGCMTSRRPDWWRSA
jgi:predicted signal transduction protein with EAL and GGDEF domain